MRGALQASNYASGYMSGMFPNRRPQIASAVALMVQEARAAGKVLTLADARSALEKSCVAITAGRNAIGFPAAGQHNTTVGFGLVDASAALNLVY